ncbi:MAG: hypothetical protein R3C11_29615 [Planctomycetaceae bacterium]
MKQSLLLTPDVTFPWSTRSHSAERSLVSMDAVACKRTSTSSFSRT